MNKKEIRIYYKNLRKTADKNELLEKSRVICEKFIKSQFYENAQTIMIYMPIQNEVDTALVFDRIAEDKKRAVLPVTDGDIMYGVYADENADMCIGQYDIKEPKVKKIADFSDIDTVIVPGICFDRKGARVGFGKGYYDKFLKNTKAKRIAFCYDMQICENAYAEEFDELMDYIITETEVIECLKKDFN